MSKEVPLGSLDQADDQVCGQLRVQVTDPANFDSRQQRVLYAARSFPDPHPSRLGRDVAWIVGEVMVDAVVSEALTEGLETDPYRISHLLMR